MSFIESPHGPQGRGYAATATQQHRRIVLGKSGCGAAGRSLPSALRSVTALAAYALMPTATLNALSDEAERVVSVSSSRRWVASRRAGPDSRAACLGQGT